MAPPSGANPIRRKICENRAVFDATTRSQARAMLQPMPTAGPRTAAMIGFSIACSARMKGMATLLQPLAATAQIMVLPGHAVDIGA